ncbi:SPOR domain-containing protein [Devosia sp. PTR5]|uniref:SPOR domain-containing protein n=1 Tax=Devosia oryzisoli TaxID=2774138 RepID=A0A927IPS6_9HYPH|nr:SPOR domain-containing protein [Devosia oryzisoli]MBD8064875.1 SPOR domain-containing protein [Devosia oryzisoli]
MAGQSEAPDDLIAELARLMAGEARDEKPSRPSVRIPGQDTLQPISEVPAPTVRIPGPSSQAHAGETRPFRFDFELGSERQAASAASERAPTETPTEPPAQQPPSETDSIADLIAAELANSSASLAPSDPEQNERAGGSPPRDEAHGEDTFDEPPVFEAPEPEPVLIPTRAAFEPVVAARPTVEPIRAEEQRAPTPPEGGQILRHEPAVETPVSPPVQPSRPTGAKNALDDIERLVGPAVRLEPAPTASVEAVPVQASPAPSSALRSLATPTAPSEEPRIPPRSARPVSDRPQEASIEEAIIAAAAASGAAVEFVDPDEADIYSAQAPRPRRGFAGLGRGFVGPLVAVTLLVVAGLGLYWVLGKSGGASGPAPLIVASTEPVKDAPEPVTEEDAAPQSVVFNEISGVDTGAEEQIVSRDQADEADVTQTAAFDPAQEGLVNRKVRTVTVRPDGTIVSGDEGLAGNSMLPVDRPNVPSVPGADFTTPEMVANADATAAAPAAGATPATPDAPANGTATSSLTAAPATDAQAAAMPQGAPVVPGSTVPAVDTTGATIVGRTAPVPLQKPSDYDQLVAALQQRQATAPQQTTPIGQGTLPPPPASVAAPSNAPATQSVAQGDNSAPAYVQLSSQRSEEAARESAANIARRYGVLFGGQNLEVQRVDLGERGVFYRVRVPASSLETANNICVNVKAAGGDCFTM